MRSRIALSLCAGVLFGAMGAPGASAQNAFNWSGFYLGGHLGYGSSGVTYYDPAYPNWKLSHSPSGMIGGAQLGFNFQSGALVYGVEADFSAANLRDGVVDTQPGFVGDRFDAQVQWIATLTARAGLAFDRALIYAKGGGARSKSEFHYQYAQAPGYGPTRLDLTQLGWTLGGGIEYALGPNWSAKVEYNFIDFGRSGAVTFTPLPDGFVGNVAQDLHLVKGGLNYRFGP